MFGVIIVPLAVWVLNQNIWPGCAPGGGDGMFGVTIVPFGVAITAITCGPAEVCTTVRRKKRLPPFVA